MFKARKIEKRGENRFGAYRFGIYCASSESGVDFRLIKLSGRYGRWYAFPPGASSNPDTAWAYASEFGPLRLWAQYVHVRDGQWIVDPEDMPVEHRARWLATGWQVQLQGGRAAC